MIGVTMDMEQYDCPFIDTTDDHAVSFDSVQWQFDGASRKLETRMVVEGRDQQVLEAGLTALTNHPHMLEYDLLRKRDDAALIRTVIDETNAMRVIRDKGGYITGPFRIENGSELWEVGFDDERVAGDALAALERNNEFSVESRESVALGDTFDHLDNADAVAQLLAACRNLTDVERETITVAAERGYFDRPRGATLQALADEFDISDTAVSKNLRRGERKIIRRVVRALDAMASDSSER